MKICNLCKKYGELTVYKNFNLEVREGEILCVLGESGSGKTTLLNCIANLTDYEGEIEKKKVSYIFQTPRLVPNLTVLKNLILVKNDLNRALEILSKVNLSDKQNAYPKTLSGGQAKRVALARALMFDGDLFLMDEPFSSLDLKTKQEVIKLFSERVREEKKTTLFVTHDIDEALEFSDRIIILKEGKISFDVEQTTREELINRLTT